MSNGFQEAQWLTSENHRQDSGSLESVGKLLAVCYCYEYQQMSN